MASALKHNVSRIGRAICEASSRDQRYDENEFLLRNAISRRQNNSKGTGDSTASRTYSTRFRVRQRLSQAALAAREIRPLQARVIRRHRHETCYARERALPRPLVAL